MYPARWQHCYKPWSCSFHGLTLSFNVCSLKSVDKHDDRSTTSKLNRFQDLVYLRNLDIITLPETWLNDSITNKDTPPYAYNIVIRDRTCDKRGGCVMTAWREGLQRNLITQGDQHNLEVIAVKRKNKKIKCLWSVCFRPPNIDVKV